MDEILTIVIGLIAAMQGILRAEIRALAEVFNIQITQVYRALDSGIAGVYIWVSSLTEMVRKELNSGLAGIVTWVNSLTATIRAGIDTSLAGIRSWVESIIAGIRSYTDSAISNLAGTVARDMLSQRNWFETQLVKFRDTYKWLEDRKLDIVSFFTDPVDFIWQRFTMWFFGG